MIKIVDQQTKMAIMNSTVIDKVECCPSQRYFFTRDTGLTNSSYTYVRLKVYQDSGIARFRL